MNTLPEQSPALSVITTTDPLAQRLPLLIGALAKLATQQNTPHELIIVDDLGQWRVTGIPPLPSHTLLAIRPVTTSHSRGQSAALLQGVGLAKAPLLATIDPDMYDCVQELPAMVALIDGKHTCVHGQRSHRHDASLIRRAGSWIVNTAIRGITGIKVPDIGSPFTLITRDAYQQVAATVADQAAIDFRLYCYLMLDTQVATYKLIHGSAADTPSHYSLPDLCKTAVTLLLSSLRTRRLAKRTERIARP